jgi:hypothetical protein
MNNDAGTVRSRLALHGQYGQNRPVWTGFRSENDAVFIVATPDVAYGYFLDTPTFLVERPADIIEVTDDPRERPADIIEATGRIRDAAVRLAS